MFKRNFDISIPRGEVVERTTGKSTILQPQDGTIFEEEGYAFAAARADLEVNGLGVESDDLFGEARCLTFRTIVG